MSITYETVLNDLKSGKIYTGISSVAKRAWFKYCYHFSHVENIVSILKDGKLLSRTQANLEEKMLHDNASQKIIDQTNLKYQDYVRLYFRPKSPTQYHNEGFKTSYQLRKSGLNAQCPVPVFLFFDIRKILNHPESRFSEKSLASSGRPELYSTPEEFSTLPFDKIYHDGAFSGNEKQEIIGHRHAEIVIPNTLPIDEYLQKIVVRSPAEKETLLNLMDSSLKEKYAHLIQIDSTNNVFLRRWTYFYNVDLFSDGFALDLRISEEKSNKRPIQFDMEIKLEENNGEIIPYKKTDWAPVSKSAYPFQTPRDFYSLTINFDGNLMYKGNYQQEENLPF